MLTWIFLALLCVVSFIVVLGFLVFFHELGHFGVARAFGIAVERFSIGYGKPIKSWTDKKGTQWSLSRIPLGGYCKFVGDAGAASNPDTEQLEKLRETLDAAPDADPDKRYFHFQPLYQRVLVVLGGPVANFILAIVIFAGLAWGFGTNHLKAVAGEIQPGMAAEAAGILPGDVILTMNGKDASSFSKVLMIVGTNSGEDLDVELLRGGQPLTLTVTPRATVREDGIGGQSERGFIGMGFDQSPENAYRRDYNLFQAVGYGTTQVGSTLAMTGRYVGRIFQGKESGKALGSVGRVAAMTSKVTIDVATAEAPLKTRLKAGMFALLTLGAMFSVGLGFANLMPIPVLDGGHLVYYGYEAVVGRPLSERKQELGFKIGLSVLLVLFVILTWNDIGYVQSLFS